MIHIEKVDSKTFKKVIDMRLEGEQNKYVAPNVVSLAQAWLYYDEARPFAIMNNDEVVGFVMLDWDEMERSVGLWRFMIGTEHQCKGYGRAAIEAIIKLAKECDDIDFLALDYVPGNTVARDLYRSFGFYETGEIEDGEIIMKLIITDTPKVGMLTADEDDIDDILSFVAKAKENGEKVPAEFLDDDAVKAEIEAEQIRRFVVYGDTIGLATDTGFFVADEFSNYADEAKAKAQKR